MVVLPDHIHALWTLPPDDADFSLRWQLIKRSFTERLLEQGVLDTRARMGRRSGERSVWQRRFWEHTIRDEDDFSRCLDYVHWNPVKHGLVERVADYRWSSFARFVELGEYTPDWGTGEVCRDILGAEWE